MTVTLASTSLIRQRLLRASGVDFTVRPPDVDEGAVKRQEKLAPPQLACKLAEVKALAVSAKAAGSLVIGADQVLAIEGRALDKPRDAEEAREHLMLLRGKTHILHTAVACSRNNVILWVHSEDARLTMRDFSDAMLDRHIARAGHDITSSVGAYKIESEGVQLFSRIEGSYFAILGLPILSLLEFLREQGELPR